MGHSGEVNVECERFERHVDAQFVQLSRFYLAWQGHASRGFGAEEEAFP